MVLRKHFDGISGGQKPVFELCLDAWRKENTQTVRQFMSLSEEYEFSYISILIHKHYFYEVIL